MLTVGLDCIIFLHFDLRYVCHCQTLLSKTKICLSDEIFHILHNLLSWLQRRCLLKIILILISQKKSFYQRFLLCEICHLISLPVILCARQPHVALSICTVYRSTIVYIVRLLRTHRNTATQILGTQLHHILVNYPSCFCNIK